MTDAATPDESGIDWSRLEYLANEGTVEGAPEKQFTPVTLNQAMVLRRVLWDVVPCDEAEEVAEYLGLTATSDEVTALEHTQAHARRMEVQGIGPVIAALADATARSITGAMIIAGGEKADIPLDGEVYEEMCEKLKPVIYQSSMAALAELMDLRLIRAGGVMLLVEEGDGDDE